MHLSVPKELAAELRCTMQVNLGIGHYELKVYQIVRTLARWRTRAVQLLGDLVLETHGWNRRRFRKREKRE